jgi:hypothetical protein
VRFKQLRNFSFNILLKSMKGQKQEHEGDLPIVDSQVLLHGNLIDSKEWEA